MKKKVIEKGEIWIISLDGFVGSEQGNNPSGNLRPCLVIKTFPELDLAFVVPMTSKQPKIPSNYYQKKGNEESYFLLHQCRTVAYQRLEKKFNV